MPPILLAAFFPAFAASLDNLEVGGVWGTPTSTDATAAWWNPAGLAAGRGTRFLLEGAPTFATVTYERAEPNPGNDIYRLSGIVPFFGVATDASVHGLGLGVAVAVPTVRGGAEVEEPGPGAWHMRDGDIKAIHVIVGGGYQFADRVAIGVSGQLVRSTWVARVNTDTMPDLADAIEAASGTPADYTDADLENPDYTATLQFDELSDTTFTFSVGARVKLDPGISIGASYIHGVSVDNTGGVSIAFGCPPTEATVARYAAERAGTCNTTVDADASVAYTLPDRVYGGISWEPNDVWQLSALGGWVHWSVYQDFQVTVSDPQIESPEGHALIEQSRQWARANHDSGFGGLDVKAHPARPFTVGARLLYDASAVPTEALSPNNYDANTWMLSAMAAWRPVGPLEIGTSWTHHFLAERTVENSSFYQAVDPDARAEDRYDYPHANGTYTGSIDRIGVSVRLQFGGKEKAPVKGDYSKEEDWQEDE